MQLIILLPHFPLILLYIKILKINLTSWIGPYSHPNPCPDSHPNPRPYLNPDPDPFPILNFNPPPRPAQHDHLNYYADCRSHL